ncbi:hypothetical protein UP10_15425 [Bradyrhizobium sp. LTSPM299]|nr:hypothetical protein UP10_15425 [Bradyrhizobium sp. LTSPM299]
MISTDGGIIARLVPLDVTVLNCFDSIDDEDTVDGSRDEKPKKPETVFDDTGFGSDTFEEPKATKAKKAIKKPSEKKSDAPRTLAEYTPCQRRIELLTRPYEPSDFDKDPRPQWAPPQAANDNQTRKHNFPALNEARNNTLMAGRGLAHTKIQNEWAFDILVETSELLDAAAPRSAWLQHSGHGAADEQEADDSANSGFGMDVVHDYGPSEEKIKKLWERGSTKTPSKDGEPWNLGTVGDLKEVLSEPSNTMVKALSSVGALESNHRNHITHLRDKNGKPLKIHTRTRHAKGTRPASQLVPDPKTLCDYRDAALPRNKRGELNVGFFGGKIVSSNSIRPNSIHFAPESGPTHSSSDPWAADIAVERARDDATTKLAECRLLVGDRPYDALTQAASGFRIGELCGGRLGNTTDSARGRNLLQIAIERIIEARTAIKTAA